MRFRKPLTDVVCPACTLTFLANDHELAPDVVRYSRCGHEQKIDYPPAFEEKMGCGPLIFAAVVFFGLVTLTGGGGFFGVLLGIVLGVSVPIGLAVLAYHLLRGSDE